MDSSEICTLFNYLKYHSDNNTENSQECHRLVSTLNNYLTKEQLNSSIIDEVIILIFDGKNGLKSVLNKILFKKEFETTIIVCFEIFYTLLNNLPKKIEENIFDINKLCITIINSSASSKQKVKALELLTCGFRKVNKSMENPDHYKDIFNVIKNHNLTTPSEKQKQYLALGTFARQFDYLIMNEHSEIKKLFFNRLSYEMAKDRSLVVSGVFDGLTEYCYSFPLSLNTDKIMLQNLYKYIKDLSVPKTHVKINNRSALTFFAHNVHLFYEYLVKEYKQIHKKLLDWLKLGYEDVKCGVNTLRMYYKGMGKYLEETPTANKDILKHFNLYFETRLKDKETITQNRRLCIQGIRYFSGAYKLFFTPEEFAVFFKVFVQNFETMYIFNEDPKDDNWEFLPHYIETLAVLMVKNNLTENELFYLEKAVISLVKFFPQLPHLHHNFAVDAVITVLVSLKLHGDHFDRFVETVMYQGVIQSVSHQHILEVEAEASDNAISVKSYLPFWLNLLKMNRHYEQYGIENCQFILKTVINELIKTLLILLDKLDTSIVENTDEEISNEYNVVHKHDFAIYLNLIDFYEILFASLEPELLQNYVIKLTNHMIEKCTNNPLISGFYKLLSSALKIGNKLNYFNQTDEIVHLCLENISKFIWELVKFMPHYKDELLIARLQVVLQCPVKLIGEILNEMVPVFITVFNEGRNHIKLAKMGLQTLKYWRGVLNDEHMEAFLIEIIPYLDSYLRSKSLGLLVEADKSEKRRKTDRTLKKRQVLMDIEPELIKFQKDILEFLGQQNDSVCRAFVAPERYLEGENWSSSKHLKIALPYDDLRIELYLDHFVPRIIDLALYCSDRKTRLVACELLQGVVMVFLGRTKQLSISELTDLDDLFKNVMMPLLKLGCDNDLIVVQIFKPLVLQIIHWYTHPSQLQSSHSAIVIETIMEGITHPTDSNLRSFSQNCVTELVKWSIKQSGRSSIPGEAHIKALIKRMRFFSSHPDPNKKLGAALIFNNTYRQLREEREIIDIYWLEILYIFVNSLDQIEFIHDKEKTIKEIQTALDHVQRVFVERRDMFMAKNSKRRVPFDLGEGTLKDVSLWLLKQTGSRSKCCRDKCKDLFIALGPLNIECKGNLNTFIKVVLKNPNWVQEYYEQNCVTLSEIQRKEDEVTVLWKWFQDFHCILDGHIFILKNNLMDVKKHDNLVKLVNYFLENLQNAELEQALNLINIKDVWYFKTTDKDFYEKLKADTIVTILKLIDICDCKEIWNEHLWKLIVNLIFKEERKEVKILLSNVSKKFSNSTEFLNCLRNYVQSISVNNNTISGLLLLQSSIGINKKLKIEKLVTYTVKDIINDLISVNSNPWLESYEIFFKFVLANEEQFKSLITYFYKSLTINRFETESDVKLGVFLLQNFPDVLLKIANNFCEFMHFASMQDDLVCDTIDYITIILKFLSKTVQYKDLQQTVCKELIRNWNFFQTYFDSDIKCSNNGLDFIKLLKRSYWNSNDFKDITGWVLNILNKKFEVNHQNLINLYEHSFAVLVEIFNYEDEDVLEKLRTGLENFNKELLLNSTLNEIRMAVFTKMVTFIPQVHSAIILLYILDNYIKSSLTIDLKPLLKKYITRKNTNQIDTIKKIYEICFDEKISPMDRYKYSMEILTPLLQNCDLNCLESLFIDNISNMVSLLKEQVTDLNVTSKMIVFILIEVLYGRIPIGGSDRPVCPITNAALNSSEKNNPKLMQLFLTSGLNAIRQSNSTNNDLIRLYKCHAYNSSVSIICNLKKTETKFYSKLFVRKEDNKDVLWHSIIDTEKTYKFEKDFDSLPKQKSIVINIRHELRSSDSESVKYIESQRLFNSSLSEDVSNFDFTNSVLRNSETSVGEQETEIMEVHLDGTKVNDHECMGVLCGLIRYVFENDIYLLPDEDDDEINVPDWIEDIKNIIEDEDSNKNVKIFWVKVVMNLIDIFDRFAKVFLEPLIKFVINGCAGDDLNYFVTDVICTICKWSKIVSPDEITDTDLIGNLVEFVMKRTTNERNDIFKFHLELVKLLVEAWKINLKIPFDVLKQALSYDIKDRKIEVGLHFSSICFSNKLDLPNDQISFFSNLFLNILKTNVRSIYRLCSQTIGFFLNYLKDVDQDEKFSNQLNQFLNSIAEEQDKYSIILGNISAHYNEIVNESHLYKLFSRLSAAPNNLKALYLKIILTRIDLLSEISNFKIENWSSYLESENLEVVLAVMEILNRTVRLMEDLDNWEKTVSSLCKNVFNPNVLCRTSMFDILITLYDVTKNEKIKLICKETLLQGLIDNELSIREKLFEFWSNNSEIPDGIILRLTYVLKELYTPKTEDSFLGYVSYILLSILNKTEESEDVIFDYKLGDCDFEDNPLITNWRLQNPSQVPLFADTILTINSVDTSNLTNTVSNWNQLRSTITTLSFDPTLTQSDETDIDYVSDHDEVVFKKPVVPTVLFNHSRFLKRSDKIKQNFAHYQVKKGVMKEQKRFGNVKEQEKKVTIYRSYRKGDLPDIQISLGSVVKPLQMLLLYDSEISKIFYASLFKLVMAKQNDSNFTETIQQGITQIFEKSVQWNTNLFRTLLDILLVHKKSLAFSPNLITSVCQESGLISTGALILEEYLISLDDIVVVNSKRGPNVNTNSETAYWIKLAELYKELDEKDVVRSIFLEKIQCKETVQTALKFEYDKQWRDALDSYQNLIQSVSLPEHKDFYYESCFNCIAQLGEWEQLPQEIESIVGDDSIWNSFWEDEWCKKKLLPWYMMAQIKNILFSNASPANLLENINKYLIVPEKDQFLRSYYSEELAILAIQQGDISHANRYVQNFIDNFLNDWQFVNPQFSNIRYKRLLKLRNIVDISTFLHCYNNLEDESLTRLENYWISSSNDILPCILQNESRLLYRRQFIKLLEKKIDLNEENELLLKGLRTTKFNLDLGFINSAIELNSFYMARKYVKGYRQLNLPLVNLALCNIGLQTNKQYAREKRIGHLLKAVKLLEPIFSNSEIEQIKLMAGETFFEISTQICNTLQEHPSLIKESPELQSFFQISSSDPLEIRNCGAAKLKTSIDEYHQHLNNSMEENQDTVGFTKIANAYLKLAYHVRSCCGENSSEFIAYVLKAMKLNSLEAKQFFPLILMECDLEGEMKEVFVTEVESVPTWMFLGWIPQLLVNLNTTKIDALSGLIVRIAEMYPQSIMYAYRLSKENCDFNDGESNDLIERLDSILLSNSVVDTFLEALKYVCMPDLYLKYFIEKMIQSIKTTSKEKLLETKNYLMGHFFANVPSSRNSESMMGNIYKTILEFKKNISSINGNNLKKDLTTLEGVVAKLRQMKIDSGSTKLLKNFSPWLANFSARKLNVELEIPGQYDGSQMPLVQHHIKISGFSPDLKVMSSLRKPIKITITGMDSKEYSFLIKFGEDIRQDQRIQQLFILMNNIFKSDLICKNKDLVLLTYQVIPLTTNLGIIQWVDNTKDLNGFMLDKISKKKLESSENKYFSYASSKKGPPYSGYHTLALKSRNQTIPFYQSLVNEIDWDVLKTSYWNISSSTEHFISLKNNFVKTYAVMCVAHWILGIGDRHLCNSMIDVKNGKVLSIDFGHAFGTGTQWLPIPELVPIRLTPHILNLMEPFKEHGFLKEFMINSLRALRTNHDKLLATMEVFIKEPSLDWIERASKFLGNDDRTNFTWYSTDIIKRAKQKLEGCNSSVVVIEELKMNPVLKKSPQHLNAFVALVKGSAEFDVRARLGKDDGLSVEEQIDCLVDHATDQNLLSRMYLGWRPWI